MIFRRKLKRSRVGTERWKRFFSFGAGNPFYLRHKWRLIWVRCKKTNYRVLLEQPNWARANSSALSQIKRNNGFLPYSKNPRGESSLYPFCLLFTTNNTANNVQHSLLVPHRTPSIVVANCSIKNGAEFHTTTLITRNVY